MCFKRLRKNTKKTRELYISFIAGSFSGLPLGIVFSLINLGNFWFNVGLLIGAISFLIILYLLGKFIISIFVSKNFNPDDTFNFKTNYISGMMSTVTVGLFILFGKGTENSIIIVALVIIMYFLVSLIHTNLKR